MAVGGKNCNESWEMGYSELDWIVLTQDGIRSWADINIVEPPD